MIQFKPSFLGRENTEMNKKLKILTWFKEHRLTMKLWDVREAEEREKFLWVWHDLGTKPPPPKHHFIHAISSFYISNGKINLPTYLEGIRDSQLINITTVLQFHFFSGSLIWHPLCDDFISSRLHSCTWKVQRKRKFWNLPFMSLGPVRFYVHYSLPGENHKLTGFEQGSWIIHWQGEWSLYLRKKFCLDKSHDPKCLITPAWKRGVMLILHSPHYLWSNSCSISSCIIYYYMVIKFFLMLTVLFYKKVVYLWSFSPFSFWSKLLLAPYTMILSVLPTLSCVQAFTNTAIPSVWRNFFFFFISIL